MKLSSKVLLCLAACIATVTVSESLECYKCQRMTYLSFTWGNDNKICLNPSGGSNATKESDCKDCYVDTYNGVYSWVDRGCVKEGEDCVTGDKEVDVPVTGWINKLPGVNLGDKFKAKRECCSDADNCNNKKLEDSSDAGRPNQILAFLYTLAAVVITIAVINLCRSL